MVQVLLVGVGGFIGSVLRFLISQLNFSENLPWATLLVNLLGCFLIGFILASPLIKSNTYYFVVTGILGGFTTYSAFAGEALSLIVKQQVALAMAYIALTVGMGFVCCLMGFSLSKNIWVG